MLERRVFGEVPPKHHVAFRTPAGALYYEECLTRKGFEGAYSILYHQYRPQAVLSRSRVQSLAPTRAEQDLRRRHFPTRALTQVNNPISARITLLHNAEMSLAVARPKASDERYYINADADELLFALRGGGTLRSVFGDLQFCAGDYVFIPKGVLYRLMVDSEDTHWLSAEFRKGVGVPQRFRNPFGQLRMDAPYCHRDFKVPRFVGPTDEGIREGVIKRDWALQSVSYQHSPLDVVGWDGCVYPWAFPIASFQPRVSSVHLPPTWHGTFESPAALVCSFVPRPLDFLPDAVPCPYPHVSVDVDEVIFYVSGDFTSRRGVAQGSVTLHPAGLPHGPHPGKYEQSIGATRTEETAVMFDCFSPLSITSEASALEDADYEASFRGSP